MDSNHGKKRFPEMGIKSEGAVKSKTTIFKVRVRSGTLIAIHTPVKIVEDLAGAMETAPDFSNGGLVNGLNLKYI